MNQIGTPTRAVLRRLAPDAQQLSELVLRLYDAARTSSVPTFQDQAMQMLGEVARFTGGWWGHAVRADAGYQVHGSHLLNLPPDVPMLLNSTDPHSPVARASVQHLNRAMIFDADTLHALPAAAALNKHMHAYQALCMTQIDTASNLLRFIALTRDRGERPFTDIDRQWLQLLMPHLIAALNLCCSVQMTKWRTCSHSEQILVTSDAKGYLHLTEPGLHELLREEWPSWSGYRLPDKLVDCMSSGHDMFAGKHVHAEFHWSGQRVLIPFRPRQQLDGLTPQEGAIARAFASGQSYKEVARNLGVAPATVRHHLRAAYQKLGVSDKAALAQLVAAAAAPDRAKAYGEWCRSNATLSARVAAQS